MITFKNKKGILSIIARKIFELGNARIFIPLIRRLCFDGECYDIIRVRR